MGRWTAADPNENAGVANRYRYVSNNPISFRDPNGEDEDGGFFSGVWERTVEKATNFAQGTKGAVVGVGNYLERTGGALGDIAYGEIHGDNEAKIRGAEVLIQSLETISIQSQAKAAGAIVEDAAHTAVGIGTETVEVGKALYRGDLKEAGRHTADLGGNILETALIVVPAAKGLKAARAAKVAEAAKVSEAAAATSKTAAATEAASGGAKAAEATKTLEAVKTAKVEGHVNLDTGSAVGFVSEGSPVRGQLKAAVEGRQMVMTETALEEFQGTLRVAGPLETARAGRLLDRVQIIPDNPSARAVRLRVTKKVGVNDKVIFGTGDRLGVPTMTADDKFVRGAAAQGVDFDVILHRPVPLKGK